MEFERTKKHIIARYVFAFFVVVAGILSQYFNLGKEFLGFSSVGTWLIYVGFVMLAIITLQVISNKKRIVDERMQFVASKAAGITYIAIIFFAFAVMVADGIKPINIPYSYFMSYLISGIVLVYFISYKILLRFY